MDVAKRMAVAAGLALATATMAPARDKEAPAAAPAPAPEEATATTTDAPAVPDVVPPPADEPAATEPAPGAPAEGEPAAPDARIVQAQQALADRFAEFAQFTIQIANTERHLDNAAFRQAATLLKAATKLYGDDPRLWRLLSESQLQLGDSDGALEALNGYRAVAPTEIVPQIQLIELYTSRMQTADKELTYLRSLMAKETVPDEVKSHVSYMIAQRLFDRGEEAATLTALDESVKLNPVNVGSLEMKYRVIAARPQATPLERATALLDLLKANPVQPARLGEFGRLLGSVGLTKEASDWMSRGMVLYNRSGGADRDAYHDLGIDYAAELYIGGQLQPARTLTDQILKGDPKDIDAWIVRLVLERGAGDKAAYEKAKAGALTALNDRWASSARHVAGEKEPAPPTEGQPAPAEKPAAAPADPAVVAKQAKDSNDPEKQSAFVSAASDFAWFEIYFNDNPGAASKWISALEAVVPENNVTLKRLRGWLALANKQNDEARKTLEPIQDADPLAALGMIRLASAAGADKDAETAADDQARKLLRDYSSGLVGAIVMQGLKDRAVKPEADPDAAAIKALAQKFPRGWLDLADNPQRFYQLRADPQYVAHHYEEPMWIRVTISNLSDQPIPIGENGIIHPGLWFDAEMQGVRSQMMPGIAFERIVQSTMLPPRQAISQFVRLDQGTLALALEQDPTPRVQITGWVMSNPVARGQGFGPGPAGYKVPFAKKLMRGGFQWRKEDVRRKLLEEIEDGLPETKIRDLSLLTAYIPGLRAAARGPAPAPDGQPQPPPDPAREQDRQAMAQISNEMFDAVMNRTNDEVPAVSQWARFQVSLIGDPTQASGAIESLLADNAWEARLLGLVAVRHLQPAKGIPMAKKLADAEVADSKSNDAIVKSYAEQVVELLMHPPVPAATQPGAATQPAAGATEEGPKP